MLFEEKPFSREERHIILSNPREYKGLFELMVARNRYNMGKTFYR